MQLPKKAWIPLVIAAVVASAAALFEWNWLRGPFSSYMTGRWGRPFAINGDLHVQLSSKPLVSAESVTLSNVPGSAEPVMVRATRCRSHRSGLVVRRPRFAA
jgi:uncharacterized protein involved in outer membrane biogenesis